MIRKLTLNEWVQVKTSLDIKRDRIAGFSKQSPVMAEALTSIDTLLSALEYGKADLYIDEKRPTNAASGAD